MMNTLEHEKFHISHNHNSKKSKNIAGLLEEVEVLMQQMSSPNFKKATYSYKRGVAGYLQDSLELLNNNGGYKEFDDVFENASSLLRTIKGVKYTPEYSYMNGGRWINF